MSVELLTRRIKRRVLDVVSRYGYEVLKDPSVFGGYRLLRKVRLGVDALADVKQILGREPRCVFDVGANVGQTAARLVDTFPQSHVYSFEPDPRSYAELSRLARACGRISAVNAAVGERDGEATFFASRFCQASSLLKTSPSAHEYLVASNSPELEAEITTRVVTLDRFCAEHRIERIDLLKIDAEGYELRVLEGAEGFLRRVAVPVIFLEVFFVSYYEGQPLFPDVYQYLYDRNYRLVALYDTGFHTHYYCVGANALFVHGSLGDRKRESSADEGRGAPAIR